MIKPRILYFITKAEVGGAQVHLAELINSFHTEFDIHLATGGDGFLAEEARGLGVPVALLKNLVPAMHPWKDVSALTEASELVANVRPDVIHAHSSKAGVIARLAALRSRRKSVFTVHGWSFADGVSWQRRILTVPVETLVSRFTDRIIMVSESDRRLAERYHVGRPGHLVVIHNGIRDVPWRSNPAGGFPARVIMVARFAPPKAHGQLLQSLASIKDMPWALWLVGDGPVRSSVEQWSWRLGIQDRVTFLGERRDVAELLAQCQIFALVSNWEGLPLTILEAMRAGLPVIASDVGGVREAVVDGESGFLVPCGHVDFLQDRLFRMIKSPELRVQMGQAGRARYERRFALPQMLDETRRVYQQVLRVAEQNAIA